MDRLKRLRVDPEENSNGESVRPPKVNVCVSHDWPKNVWKYGNERHLLRCKPFLVEDIDNGRLGNPAAMELIHTLKPDFWFAAHMHFKFAAIVPHDDSEEKTKFLALDKIVPGRDFLQVLDIPITNADEDETTGDTGNEDEGTLQMDPEWLTILRTDGRSDCVSEEEICETVRILKEKEIDTTVRMVADFERRAAVHDGSDRFGKMPMQLNFEAKNLKLLSALNLPDPPGLVRAEPVNSHQ